MAVGTLKSRSTTKGKLRKRGIGAGRPSILTEDLSLKIRALVLAGTKTEKLREELSIPKGTWDNWLYRDNEGFREKYRAWKRESMYGRAEEILNEDMTDENAGRRLRSETARFVAERIGKNEYSTRIEEAQLGNFTVKIVKYGEKELKEPGNP